MDYNPAIHNPSASMGAGTAEGGKGVLLFNAIPHVAMQGSVFSSFMGKAPSLMKGITGADPGEMKVAMPTPGVAMKADVLNR